MNINVILSPHNFPDNCLKICNVPVSDNSFEPHPGHPPRLATYLHGLIHRISEIPLALQNPDGGYFACPRRPIHVLDCQTPLMFGGMGRLMWSEGRWGIFGLEVVFCRTVFVGWDDSGGRKGDGESSTLRWCFAILWLKSALGSTEPQSYD